MGVASAGLACTVVRVLKGLPVAVVAPCHRVGSAHAEKRGAVALFWGDAREGAVIPLSLAVARCAGKGLDE